MKNILQKYSRIVIIFTFLLLITLIIIFWGNIKKGNGNSVEILDESQEDQNEVEQIEDNLPIIDEESDLIYLQSPQPGDIVTSPLTITGEARGYWFFEASFPVLLTNWDGLIIAQGIATAQGDWMTEDFVPFTAVLEFEEKQEYSDRGTLILQKDNPSGLPEHDDALEIPVNIGAVAN